MIARVKAGDVLGAVKRALDLLGGIEEFVDKGDVVLVKPNLTRVTSEPHVCTSPEVVYAIAKLCREAGAREVIVAEPSPVGVDTLEAFRASGVGEAARRAGAKVVDLKRCEFVRVEVPGGKAVKSLEVAKPVLETDVLIDAPKMKTHCTCIITCALKNLKGVLSDVSKREMHRAGLFQAIADLCTVVKPDLVVVDGVVCMEGLGPVSGDPVRMDLIVAGADPLAVDATCARIMSFDPERIEVLVNAYKKGIGKLKEDEIEVVGEKIEDVRRKFKPPPMDIGEYFGVTGLKVDKACSGCIGTLITIFEAFKRKGELHLLKDYFFIAGPVEEIPEEAKGKKLVLFGNCTIKLRDKGLFIPGCPPRFGLAIPTLRQGEIIDKYEKEALQRLAHGTHS